MVRVDPDGRSVMAGRAAPLTDIEIKAGGEVIDRVTATATGEWVSIPGEPLAAGDQELSLTAVPKDGEPMDSRQVVVVSVPEPAAEPVLDQPVAVIVDRDRGGEGRILQAPDKLQSPGDERLALKLVDYDDRGAIRLSGEAPPGVPVRIYVDNVPAALVIGDGRGYWITTLDQNLPGGDYTLRLDQLDHKGQTVARLETPLTRVATPPARGQAKVDYVVVQPGNSLWRIARRLSGDGFNYVDIFEANQGQIRDPNVIYPGQVFEVPPMCCQHLADLPATVPRRPGLVSGRSQLRSNAGAAMH
ncbi:MAG: LysM peptidoglycan-binding domain-containing protein [Rhizobiales bacterium]|nr:LysM peptidoglycan-binding domain-containing protein [Hyphomicrobiales bacterium]